MNQKVIYQITFSRSKTNFFSKPGIKTKNSLDLNYFLVFSSTGVSFDFIAYFRLDAEIMFVFDRKKFLKLIKAPVIRSTDKRVRFRGYTSELIRDILEDLKSWKRLTE
jgi:hypothetical protein